MEVEIDKPIVIAVLAGTTRQQRLSIRAARYVAEFGAGLPGIEIIFVDPKDFIFSGDGKDPEGQDPRYSAIAARADAFFIVTPEYNHSFPGSLKRMLDSEWQNYNRKPVLIAGASNGNWGGVRAVEALTVSVRQMGLIVTRLNVYFSWVQNLFDDNNQPVADKKEEIDKNILTAYNELIWFTKTLQYGRENF